jgi:hypothetical protein
MLLDFVTLAALIPSVYGRALMTPLRWIQASREYIVAMILFFVAVSYILKRRNKQIEKK